MRCASGYEVASPSRSMKPTPPSDMHTPSEPIPAALLQRWQHVPAAIIADITEGACQIDPAIRPLRPAGQQPRLCGNALTAQCAPADIGAVMRALQLARAGDVLVIAADGQHGTATIGSILGGYLRSRGAAGLICDGAIRDVAELAAWSDFSVFARCITPRGPSSFVRGEVNRTVLVGGRQIAPGDLIIGDDDGLVSLTPAEAAAWIAAAEAKLETEKQWRLRLAQGVDITTALGL
jgi:4-hydroxy-4-methyl-2-oxoglutarate aldolase